MIAGTTVVTGPVAITAPIDLLSYQLFVRRSCVGADEQITVIVGSNEENIVAGDGRLEEGTDSFREIVALFVRHFKC